MTNPAVAYWADPTNHAGRPVLIVEGPTDALAARQTGHDVAALIGASHATNPTTATTLIQAFGPYRPYIIMTDPDPAGRHAAHQLVQHLQTHGATAIESLPEHSDLAAWAAQLGNLAHPHLQTAIDERPPT